MIKLDIQGFECKVKAFPIVMGRFNVIRVGGREIYIAMTKNRF